MNKPKSLLKLFFTAQVSRFSEHVCQFSFSQVSTYILSNFVFVLVFSRVHSCNTFLYWLEEPCAVCFYAALFLSPTPHVECSRWSGPTVIIAEWAELPCADTSASQPPNTCSLLSPPTPISGSHRLSFNQQQGEDKEPQKTLELVVLKEMQHNTSKWGTDEL